MNNIFTAKTVDYVALSVGDAAITECQEVKGNIVLFTTGSSGLCTWVSMSPVQCLKLQEVLTKHAAIALGFKL